MHIDQWWHTTTLLEPNGPRRIGHDNAALYVDWKWYRANAGGADVLIIAGDLSNSIEIALTSLKQAAQVYKLVVFVDGNHEHYNKTAYSQNMDTLSARCAGLPNVAFLCAGEPVFTYNDVAFVGANGWYDWLCHTERGISRQNAYHAWQRQLSDLPMIRFDKGDPSVLAVQHSAILAQAVHALQRDDTVARIVMVTHTNPRADGDTWRGNFAWDVLTPSFVNSQMRQVLEVDEAGKIGFWIFGHTHVRSDRMIDGVRYVNNCRGYPRELTPWSIVQIEV
jgi:predicted phosphohydrolase